VTRPNECHYSSTFLHGTGNNYVFEDYKSLIALTMDQLPDLYRISKPNLELRSPTILLSPATLGQLGNPNSFDLFLMVICRLHQVMFPLLLNYLQQVPFHRLTLFGPLE